MPNEQWLNNLKKGDLVLVENDDRVQRGIVARTTSTLIILENKRRFKKKTGVEHGTALWGAMSLLEPTEALVKEADERQYLLGAKPYILDQIAKGLTYEAAKKIVAIFKNYNNQE